jgi:hypothetical protein
MSFLRSRDYLPQIQTTILSQLTKSDPLVQADAEGDAQEEISSYLRQRFDLTTAFADTVVFRSHSHVRCGTARGIELFCLGKPELYFRSAWYRTPTATRICAPPIRSAMQRPLTTLTGRCSAQTTGFTTFRILTRCLM